MLVPAQCLFVQRPMTFCTFLAPGSLAGNCLCGVSVNGPSWGYYTVDALNKLIEAIKACTTLTSLKCI